MAYPPEQKPANRRARKSAAAYRTISEVASELDLRQHVLRFWETKFPQINPTKLRGNRRYYRPEDVAFLRRIRSLLYDEGYTIRGVQKLLRENGGKDEAVANEGGGGPEGQGGTRPEHSQRRELEALVGELEALRDLLRRPID